MLRNIRKFGLDFQLLISFLIFILLPLQVQAQEQKISVKFPKLSEDAVLTFAPEVPPPIQRKKPAIVKVYLNSTVKKMEVIGEIFDHVYREADLVSAPARSIQTTLVPAGGATVVEFGLEVPGTYTLVDHAIFRVEKGAVGYLAVEGDPQYDIYASDQDPVICPGCLVHP